MNSNGEIGDFVLKDINYGDEFILPRESGVFYSCGRSKTNKISTSSLLASREHCSFRYCSKNNEMQIIDLNSANGTYINGMEQQKNVMISLKLNDYIGLGTDSMTPDPNPGRATPTVYQLLLAIKSEDAPNNAPSSSRASGHSNTNERRKSSKECKRKNEDSRASKVPSKIPKIEENEIKIKIEQNKDRTKMPGCSREPAVPSNVPSIENHTPDIIDIDDSSSDEQIVLVKTADEVRKYFSKTEEKTREPKVHNSVNEPIAGSSKITGTSDSSRNSPSSNKKDKVNKENIEERPETEKRRKSVEKERKKDSPHRSSKREGKDSSSRQNGGYSRKGSSSENSSDEETRRRRKREKKAKEEEENFLVEELNLEELRVEVKDEEKSDFTGEENPARIEQWIKYEPELSLTDNLEGSAEIDTGNHMTNGSFPEIRERTSLKLKFVKPEIKTEYSQTDVVTLSDDDGDGDFFPASQLFGDFPEDEICVHKPETADDQMGNARNIDDISDDRDYADVIVLSDSEDEDDSWYNRLYNSKLNQSQEVPVKTEEPEEEPELPIAPLDFPIDVYDQLDIFNICFPDSKGTDAKRQEKRPTISEDDKPSEQQKPEQEKKLDKREDEQANKRLHKEHRKSDERRRSDDKKLHEEKNARISKRKADDKKPHDDKRVKINETPANDRHVQKSKPKDRKDDRKKSLETSRSSDGPSTSVPRKNRNDDLQSTLADSLTIRRSTDENSRSASNDSCPSTSKISSTITSDGPSTSVPRKNRNDDLQSTSMDSVTIRRLTDEHSRSASNDSCASTSKISSTVTSDGPSTSVARKNRNDLQSILTDSLTIRRSTDENSRSASNDSCASTSKNSSTTTLGTRTSKNVDPTTIQLPIVMLTKLDNMRKSLGFDKKALPQAATKSSPESGSKKSDKSSKIEHRAERAERPGGFESDLASIDDFSAKSKVHKPSEKPQKSKVPSSIKLMEEVPAERKKSSIKLVNGVVKPAAKLTGKMKKDLAYEAKVKEKMHLKEQQKRRLKNTWAVCLPPGKAPACNLTRQERDEIKQDRKEKLKKLAEEKKTLENNKNALKRPATKPRAKVTEKTRNDFLVTEMVAPSTSKPSTATTADKSICEQGKSPSNDYSTNQPSTSRSSPIVENNEAPSKKQEETTQRRCLEKKNSPHAKSHLPISDKNSNKNESMEESRPRHRMSNGNESSDLFGGYSSMPSKNNDNRSESRSRIADKLSNKEKSRGESIARHLTSNGNKLGESHEKAPKFTIKKRSDSGVENINPESNGHDNTGEDDTSVNNISKLLSASLTIETGKNRICDQINQLRALKKKKDLQIPGLKSCLKSCDRSAGSGTEDNANMEMSDATTKDEKQENNHKRVTFVDVLSSVQIFEIQPGNTMKKCPAKDVPTQRKPKKFMKRAMNGAINGELAAASLKLQQFMTRVFFWRPVWLEEQQQFRTPPPIVDPNHLLRVPLNFPNYEEYRRIMEPLLALGLWDLITKEYENRQWRNFFFTSVVCNSVTVTTLPSTTVRVTKLMLEVLITKHEMESRMYPVFGDLINFQYASTAKGRQSFYQAFAYIDSCCISTLTSSTTFNQDLRNHVKEPHALVTYEVTTKDLGSTEIETNRVSRMSKICKLRAGMRYIQAVQHLPMSPLLNQIMNPKKEDYQLPLPNVANRNLLAKDSLNPKQLEAVTRVIEAVRQNQPKICLIHGPPGTGKTEVIVNLVHELFRLRDRKLRILVCASSNAAVDEIVLKLMDVRQQKEKKDRFNMVRVGREELMHPTAHQISLQVLAKKDVKQTTQTLLTTPLTSISDVEEEKRILAAQMNALELELLSNQTINSADGLRQQRKLDAINAKYSLLMSCRPGESVEALRKKEMEKMRNSSESALLIGADVIACPLSACMTGLMETTFSGTDQQISVCIVDEATQSAEVETLIPLMLGVQTLVLVGDIKHIPTTIMSQRAKGFGLDRSLFTRIHETIRGPESCNPIINLDIQYRMTESIASWPSKFFYEGSMNTRHPWNLPYQSYKLFNHDSRSDSGETTSISSVNTGEATLIATLVHTMIQSNLQNRAIPNMKIGILTAYQNQIGVIQKSLRDRLASIPKVVLQNFEYDVHLIDNFQGQERDVIIISCVSSVGPALLADRQRLRLAMTRAKHSMFICGKIDTYSKDPMWNSLLLDARNRHIIVDMPHLARPDMLRPHIFR